VAVVAVEEAFVEVRGRGPIGTPATWRIQRPSPSLRLAVPRHILQRSVVDRGEIKSSGMSGGVCVPGERTSTLRFLAEPGHVNFGGKVHGGIHFLHPSHAGQLVEFSAGRC
jgi:hypothetical protein